jgi:hypothetical protein
MRRPAAIRLVAIALALAFRAVPCAEPVCDRVVAIGDLHGGYEPFVRILREARLIDENGAWADPRACLVQLGDVADRGGRPRLIYERIMDLERQAPGRVAMLLGNHEVMNMVGDLRYTNRSEFEEFAEDETSEERAAGFAAYRESGLASGDAAKDRIDFDSRFPPGWFAHRREFSPAGRYGAWLLRRPVLHLANGTLFVHGGVTEEIAREGVGAANRRARAEIEEFLRLRDRLVAAGVLGSLVTFTESFPLVAGKMEALGPEAARGGGPGWVEDARRYLALSDALAFSATGPLWNRDLATMDEDRLSATIGPLLSRLGAARVVVGHTTQDDGRIHARAGRRVFLVDTGAGAAYGSRSSALEIDWTGRILAIYPGSSEPLDVASVPDDVVERFLREGKVIESREIGSGITHPRHVVLERDGLTLAAAFKSVDIHRQEPTRMERSGLTFEYTDSYKNERAAYLLDRLLGIGMVPPSVLRSLEGVEGALVEWVVDAVNERQRIDGDLKPADPLLLTRQRDVMKVLDALIANADRNLGNQLTTPLDFKLHLIDHSRSFRLEHTVPEAYRREPSSLPRALLDRLEGLEQNSLEAALAGLATRAQVKALLYRRDVIVRKVEADRRQYGDAIVFHDSAPPLER